MVSMLVCTQATPSVFVSQHKASPVCSCAPLFCMMMHVTTYLKGLLIFASSLRHSSMMDEHHELTRAALYSELARVLFIATLTISLTCSLTNSFSPSSSMAASPDFESRGEPTRRDERLF